MPLREKKTVKVLTTSYLHIYLVERCETWCIEPMNDFINSLRGAKICKTKINYLLMADNEYEWK